MKATGIVRRIDDLGRVVIPKEIRRTMRIREGDPLEIYTGKDGEVVFKKYSPMGELSAFAAQIAGAVQAVSGFPCAVCDRDQVVAFAGAGRREALERPISGRCEEVAGSRKLFVADSEQAAYPLLKDQDRLRVAASFPILAGGDLVGSIGLIAEAGKGVTQTEEKLLQATAIFLGKQMED